MQVRRGQIYFADLNPAEGSMQGGTLPVIVIQNDYGNRHAPTTIVAPITSISNRPRLPTQVEISDVYLGLHTPALVLLEQMRTVDKRRLLKYIDTVTTEAMNQIDSAIAINLGLKHS